MGSCASGAATDLSHCCHVHEKHIAHANLSSVNFKCCLHIPLFPSFRDLSLELFQIGS